MQGKRKSIFLSLLVLAFALAVPREPLAYAVGGTTFEATVYRYAGDLAGYQQIALRKEKGQVLVPLRKYAELMGLTADYDTRTKQTTVESVKTKLVVKAGSASAVVNGKKRSIPGPIRTVNGAAWISIDFMTQVFPAKIDKYKTGYVVHLQESYLRKQIGGERFILHDQTGDLFLSTPSQPSPRKIASLDRRVNMPQLAAEKTENGNYYVSVEELEGDGAIFSHSTYSSLYIRGGKEFLQYSTVNYEHNRLHRFQSNVVFVKDGNAMFIDDATGNVVRTVPFGGRGLIDIQGDVWVTKYDGFGLYFPESKRSIDASDLIAGEKERSFARGFMECPVSPRCGSNISYKGREGNRLVFIYGTEDGKQKEAYYDLQSVLA